jgi:cell division septation protein DedD
MTRRTLAAAFVAALFGLSAGPALPQNPEPAPAAAPAKPKPAPKTPTGADTVTVIVTNSRKTDLVELQAAESGSVSWKKVLGALKAGQQASATFPRSFNCRFNLHGRFTDGQTMEADDVEVCTQKTLNLTD